MEENNKKQTLMIVGMLALLVVLFICVKVIFNFLEDTLPKPVAPPPAVSEQLPAQESDGPNFCPYCGEELFEAFQWEQYCPDCGKQVTKEGA